MHWQRAPHGECKVVRCTQGEIYDVVIDMRSDSPTYCQWVGAELTSKNRDAFYIPEGCAHGFQTLADDSEVFYQMSEFFVAEFSGGVRWDDTAFGIAWPLPVGLISDRDKGYPDMKAD